MNAIPHLSGAALETTSKSFANKALMIVKNPDNNENDRVIESMTLEDFFRDAGRIVISESKPTDSDYKDDADNLYATGTIWVYTFDGNKKCRIYTLVKVSDPVYDEETHEMVGDYSAIWIDNSANFNKELEVAEAMKGYVIIKSTDENGDIQMNYVSTQELMGNSGITYLDTRNPTLPESNKFNTGDRWINTLTGDIFMLTRAYLGSKINFYWKWISNDESINFRAKPQEKIHGAQNYDSEFNFGRLIADNTLTEDVFKSSTDFIELTNGGIIIFLNDKSTTGHNALFSNNGGNNWRPILKSNFDFHFEPSTYYETSNGVLYLSVKDTDNNKFALLRSSDGGFSWFLLFNTDNKDITYITEDEYGNVIVHNTYNAWAVYHDGTYKHIELDSNTIIKVIIYNRMYFITPGATYELTDDYETEQVDVKSLSAYESVLIDKIVCLFSESGISYKTINTTFTPNDAQSPFSESIPFSNDATAADPYEFGKLSSGGTFDNYKLIGFDEKSLIAVLNNTTKGCITFFDGKVFTDKIDIPLFDTNGQICTNAGGNPVYKNACKFIGDFIFINGSSEGKVYIVDLHTLSTLGNYPTNVLPILVNDNIYLYGENYATLDIIPFNIFTSGQTITLSDTDSELVKSIKNKIFKLSYYTDSNNVVKPQITMFNNVEPENEIELKSIYTHNSSKVDKLFIHNEEITPGAIISGFDEVNLVLKYKYTPSDLHIIPYLITDDSDAQQLMVSVDMNFYHVGAYDSTSTYEFFIYEKYLVIKRISSGGFAYFYWIDVTDMKSGVMQLAGASTTVNHDFSMEILNDVLYMADQNIIRYIDLLADEPKIYGFYLTNGTITSEILEAWDVIDFTPASDKIKIGCESGYLVIMANDTTNSKTYLIYAKHIKGKGLVHSSAIEMANYVPDTNYDKVPVWHKFLYYILSDGKVYRKEINSNNLEEYLDSVTDMANCKLMDFVKNDKYCYFVVSDGSTEETSLIVMKDDFIEYKIKLGTSTVSKVKIFDMNHKVFIDIQYTTSKSDGDYYGHTYTYDHELYLYQETREGGVVKLVDSGKSICPIEYSEDKFVIIKDILIGSDNYIVFNNYNLNNFAPYIEKNPELLSGDPNDLIGLPTKGKLLPKLLISDGSFVWSSFEYGVK